jgi:hypothetical protein
MTQKQRYVLECGPDGAEARFSPDKRHRYRLHRWLTSGSRMFHENATTDGASSFWRSVVFVMLNPSTADAFKLDNTITKCVRFAKSWNFDRLDVVNLFSLRSPYPRDLLTAKRARLSITDDVNDAHIIGACQSADLVIAAWGSNGDDERLGSVGRSRGEFVREWLRSNDIELHHLGTTESGSPLHPLARGRHWIPYDRKPELWRA